jgi:hypothetical protein
METFKQDYRLQQEDLNYWFYSEYVAYQIGLSQPYSPFWVRYGLGYINPDDTYHEFGARYRIPDQLQIGLFRPNFAIGTDWYVGTYEVRWKYQIYENSEILIDKVRFQVTTAGIYNTPGVFPSYVDLPASMMVV